MHQSLSFGVVKEGNLKVDFTKESFIVKKDSLVCFNRFQPHQSQNIDAKGYFAIYIDNNWLNSKFNNPIICKNIIEYKDIYNIVNLAFNSKKASFFELILEDIISKNSIAINKIDSKIVDKMLDFIYKNIEDKISIQTIAKRLNYNKEYLIRKFKTQMGLTPQQFITSLKIEISANKLLQKNLSLTDIAYNYSFFDQSHYIKTFKSIYGISPKIYKKSIFYN